MRTPGDAPMRTPGDAPIQVTGVCFGVFQVNGIWNKAVASDSHHIASQAMKRLVRDSLICSLKH